MRIEGEHDPFMEEDSEGNWVESSLTKRVEDELVSLSLLSAHTNTEGLSDQHVGIIMVTELSVNALPGYEPSYILTSGVVDLSKVDHSFIVDICSLSDLAINVAMFYPAETLGLEVEVYKSKQEATTAALMTLIGN